MEEASHARLDLSHSRGRNAVEDQARYHVPLLVPLKNTDSMLACPSYYGSQLRVFQRIVVAGP